MNDRLLTLEESHAELLEAARAFVAYHTGEAKRLRTGTAEGCSNCGGVPHSATCQVVAFGNAIAHAEKLRKGTATGDGCADYGCGDGWHAGDCPGRDAGKE